MESSEHNTSTPEDAGGAIPASVIKTFDMVMGGVVPSTKYFDVRFDQLQVQIDAVNGRINETKDSINHLRLDMDRRFEDVNRRFGEIDKRFEQVDKRFEQVDKRFEQIDKRFEHIEQKLDKIVERIDVRIDNGLKENRNLIVRLFTFALTFSAISFAGLLGKLLKLF